MYLPLQETNLTPKFPLCPEIVVCVAGVFNFHKMYVRKNIPSYAKKELKNRNYGARPEF